MPKLKFTPLPAVCIFCNERMDGKTMNTLGLILQSIKELLSIGDLDKAIQNGEIDGDYLFGTDETDAPNGDHFKDEDITGDLTEEELKEYTAQKELKELKTRLTAQVSSILSDGSVSVETAENIQAALNKGFSEESLKELEEIVSNVKLEDTAQKTVITDAAEISNTIESIKTSTKEGILEQAGGIENIKSVEIYENGNYKISTNDNNTFTAYPSGKYVASYDSELRTGIDVFSEENKIETSTYIDHARNEAVVNESYTHNEDGSYTKVTENSNEPDIKNTVEVSSENEIVSIKTENTKTGEITSSFTAGKDNDTGSIIAEDTGAISGELGTMQGELEALENEKTQAENNLEQNQTEYDSTEEEKNAALGTIDSDIASKEDELSNAAVEKSEAENAVSDAQNEADAAAEELDKCSENKNECQDTLDEANDEVTESQGCADEKQAANCDAKQEEAAAKSEQSDANCDYGNAASETAAASSTAATTSANHAEQVGEVTAAFNVRNQKQAEVNAAQKEYNNAQASKSEDKSLWAKFKNWVSSLFDKLSDAIAGRDAAQRELENEQREEERLKAIDDEAQRELEEKEEIQEEKKDVLEAATEFYELKTAQREVTDQEYADALLDLADSISVRDEASDEYDSALELYMEANDYKVDADGNLTDAEGNLVDVSQVVEELETFVQGLCDTRVQTENDYNDVLEATAAVIAGDEQQIETLGEQITALQTQIAQEEARIALEEQMTSELAKELGEINAAQDGEGIVDDIADIFVSGNDEARDAFEQKRELLEKAIESGSEEDLIAAYQAIYGGKEVALDENGNIVLEFEGLSEEELGKLQVVPISELEGDNLQAYMNNESQNALSALNTFSALDNGTFTVNGKTVTTEDITNILAEQADLLFADMENAKNNQGIISKGISFVNDIFGFGTSESEMQTQVEHYKDMIQNLADCSSPADFAAMYKSITGRDFNVQNLSELLAYDSAKNPEETTQETANDTAGENQVSLDEVVNMVKEYSQSPENLLQTGNSKAMESIQDYVATQNTAKEAVNGVITGVVAAAAVAAAPFTGGASLLLGAAVGAGTNVGLNTIDSIYDADGDGTTDFNYSLQEAAGDALIGAATGFSGTLASKAGSAVTSMLGGNSTGTAVSTTFKEYMKNALVNFGTKSAGRAAEGFIDGSIGATGEYFASVASGDTTFTLEGLGQTALMGGSIGSVFNVGLGAAGDTVSGIGNIAEASDLGNLVNRALAEGNSGNELADIIASKLDDSLLTNGQVNRYAMTTLTQNAQDALGALKKAGLSDDLALDVLRNSTLEAQTTMPAIANAIHKNMGGFVSANNDVSENIANIMSTATNIDIDNFGRLRSFSATDINGSNFEYIFDGNGKLLVVSTNDFVELNEDELIQFADKVNILTSNGKLPAKGLEGIKPEDLQNVNSELIKDIDLLYEAFDSGTDEIDIFVQKFADSIAAAENIQVGDVCRIDGTDNISIKLADGTLQELNISAEKYMELFPPVSRYASFQQKIGDCYLVSTLSAMMKTPETRVNILQCFTENADGSLTISIPNSKVSLTIAEGKNITDYIANSYMNYKIDAERIVGGEKLVIDGADGIKMVEYLYGLELLSDGTTDLLQRYNNALLYNNQKLIQELEGKINLINSGADPSFVANTLRGNGGWMENVLKRFGLTDTSAYFASEAASGNILDNTNVSAIIDDPANWDQYMITGSTKGADDRFFLDETYDMVGNHAYSVELFMSDSGETLFRITNPWHTNKTVVLTKDQMNEFFTNLTFTKIK